MRNVPPTNAGITIDLKSATAIYAQIYDRIKQSIVRGDLLPGERVPAVRSLAVALGVARGTVEAAYERLAGEGFLISAGQKGTIVAPAMALRQATGAALASPHPAARALNVPGADARPFQLGLPALDVFPRKLWTRIAARAVRSAMLPDYVYPNPTGVPELKRALAAYLRISRGVRCAPEQIFITPSHQGTMDLIFRVLLADNPTIWVEDPCYWFVLRLAKLIGAKVHPVAVDENGMRIADGVAGAPGARAAFVTPSHQFPLGVPLSIKRRMELLAWANEAGAWIVEDDYDSEYQYVGKPLPALKSLDTGDRVIYCGTFSKVLFPALRIAYLVVPPSQVDKFQETALLLGNTPSPMMQRAVADFISEGHFGRHLNKMRKVYGARRLITIAALKRGLGDHVTIDDCAGGMHLILRLPFDDEPLKLAAQEAGLGVQSLSSMCIAHHAGNGLLVGFTNTTSEGMADAYVARLKAAAASIGLAI